MSLQRDRRIFEPITLREPPVTPQDEEVRRSLVARMRSERGEMMQLFIDCEHWNRTHSNEQPIDCDPDGLLAKLIARFDDFFASEAKRNG